MKILLDENIDIRFKKLFPNTHEVYTIRDMNWNGIKNGELLKLLKENQFDCWIVVDKNIAYQQNISKLPCSILVLDVVRNTIKQLSPLISSILTNLDNIQEIKVIIVPEK
jgi:predicted nuclease of predicted toxin-antitoxin system